MKRNLAVFAVVVLTVAAMLFAGRYMARKGGRASIPGRLAGEVRDAEAPNFELKSLEGKTIRLSDFRGQAVLINFWATWCQPCKIEMPWFAELNLKYGPQGLQVIGIAMDDVGESEIAKFAKEVGANYTILIGKEAVGEAYGGVQFLPATFYVDRQGKIVDRVFGLVSHSEIEDNIKKALARQPEAPKVATSSPSEKKSEKQK